MTPPPLLENILGQPDSLRGVAEYQFGEGLAALELAASTLRDAGRIVLSGMGSSLFGCVPLESYLNRRGIPAVAIDTSELLHYRSALCGPGTVVLLVSRSGETVEALKVIEKLKHTGSVVIGVTNEPGTTLQRETRHSVLVGSARDQMVAVQTYSGTAATLLLLGAALCRELDGLRAGLAAAAEALDVLVEECVSASETWRDFFQPARAIYLLGRGASIASALEGALLFHETAKTPAVSMAAAHFRHGPVEVVNGEFRGVVFASQAQAADLDEALARDLRQLGARVFPIGPFAEESISWKTDGVPELFAPLLEIVTVQLAGLRLAQWNGIVPGEFRFASAVTQTETGFSKAGLSKDGLSKE